MRRMGRSQQGRPRAAPTAGGMAHKEVPLVSKQHGTRRAYGTGRLYVKSGSW
jgi:hypothetical protein